MGYEEYSQEQLAEMLDVELKQIQKVGIKIDHNTNSIHLDLMNKKTRVVIDHKNIPCLRVLKKHTWFLKERVKDKNQRLFIQLESLLKTVDLWLGQSDNIIAQLESKIH